MPTLKCENGHCKNDVPEDNIDRVCAYQLDELVEHSRHGYRNYLTCNCCDLCRNECHQAAVNPQSDMNE